MCDDIVAQARKYWQEMTDGDGGECGEMRMFRELADEIERLRLQVTGLEALLVDAQREIEILRSDIRPRR